MFLSCWKCWLKLDRLLKFDLKYILVIGSLLWVSSL